MYKLSDEMLLEAYYKAVELSLSVDFIHLIKGELRRRNIAIK